MNDLNSKHTLALQHSRLESLDVGDSYSDDPKIGSTKDDHFIRYFTALHHDHQ